MPLKSILFRGDHALEACPLQDAAHIKQGAREEHVAQIQTAISVLNGYTIATSETGNKTFGASTAAAVLAFKKKNNVINRSYQSQPDNIVGKMTIAALDEGMAGVESRPNSADDKSTFFYSA